MNVRFTPEAEAQADEIDLWWRENRPDARDLFARELAEFKGRLLNTPMIGTLYTVLHGKPVRKLLMPRTRHHLYYEVRTEEGLIVVHAVWGAPKGSGPKL